MTDYKSMFEQAVRTLAAIDRALDIGEDGCGMRHNAEKTPNYLIKNGSMLSPGYMNVEGVVIYEQQTDTYWKAIINK